MQNGLFEVGDRVILKVDDWGAYTGEEAPQFLCDDIGEVIEDTCNNAISVMVRFYLLRGKRVLPSEDTQYWVRHEMMALYLGAGDPITARRRDLVLE